MTDKKLKEIKESVQSHIKCFGLEGAEEEIKKHYTGDLQRTMLFILKDRIEFGEGRLR